MILPGHLFWRPCIDLLQRSCQEVSYINLAERAFIERSHKKEKNAEGSLIDILPRGLAKRLLKEICTERALIEILEADLAWRPLMEILCRDLVKRAEVLLGDHYRIYR